MAALAARGRQSLAELERRLRLEPGVEQVAFSRAFLQIAAGILAGSVIVALKIDFGSPPLVLYLVGADAVMLAAELAACMLPLRPTLGINPTAALRAEA